jgi:thioredoxin 1
MNRRILMSSLVIGLAILISGCSHAGTKTTPNGSSTSGSGSSNSNQVATQSSQYQTYSEASLAAATADGGKAVIFFHANWCSTCKAAEKEILSKADQIPDNITILKTDFDSQTALKKKYQIVTQHTFVQVDADGNEITKWVGGGLDAIIKRTI